MAETAVTKAMAPAGLFGNDAKLLIPFFTTGAAAKAEPLTNTNALL